MLQEITLKMAAAMTPIEQSIVSNPSNLEQLEPFCMLYYDMKKSVEAHDEWDHISFASMMDEEFLGRIEFTLKGIPRIVIGVAILSYVAFTEKAVLSLKRVEFVKDVCRAFDEMLMNRGYGKIDWFSILGGTHSHEQAYRALVEKAGKIVGTRIQENMGRSGRVYDIEEYEVYRERWQQIRQGLHLSSGQ